MPTTDAVITEGKWEKEEGGHVYTIKSKLQSGRIVGEVQVKTCIDANFNMDAILSNRKAEVEAGAAELLKGLLEIKRANMKAL